MGTRGGKRILLAEDNPNDLELSLAALAEHNLAEEVAVTRDGDEALDYLYHRGAYLGAAGGAPAVVLLDLKMPRVSGLEVLRQVRSDPQLRALPVVMLTSSREERDLLESYRLGANAYVVKSVDFRHYVSWVKSLGFFWAVINEPPPAALMKIAPRA